MEVKQAVETAVQVFIANPDCDYVELTDALERAGLTAEMASRMVEFLPLAFGREFLGEGGPQFPPDYTRRDREGRERFRGLLQDEPVYREALAIMPLVAAQGKDALWSILGRSSEMDAVNQALHKGSELRNLLVSPPILIWEAGIAGNCFSAARRTCQILVAFRK